MHTVSHWSPELRGSATRLHRACGGLARGWTDLRYGWDSDGFPRLGWWAITASGKVYLGRTATDVTDKYESS